MLIFPSTVVIDTGHWNPKREVQITMNESINDVCGLCNYVGVSENGGYPRF